MNCYECSEEISEKETKIFTCKKCKKMIHDNCLLYSKEQIKNLNLTECDNCRLIISEKNFIKKKCEICNKEGSKLCLHKWINVNKITYIHKKCARWFIKINYEYENNFIVFKSKTPLNLNFILYDGKCNFCRKNEGNFFIKCKIVGCEIYTHEKCISVHRESYQFGEKDHLEFFCNKHKIYMDSNRNTKILNSFSFENKNNILNRKENNKEKIVCSKKENQLLYNKNNNQNIDNTLRKKNNKDEDFNQEEMRNKIIQKEIKYGYISTVNKCELCNIEISFNDEKIKKKCCKTCLSFYHMDCLSKIINYSKKEIKKKYKCPICFYRLKSKQLENKTCLICNHSNKCNLIIGKNIFHYICIIAFKRYFHSEFQNFNFEKIKRKICCICNKNGYSYQCERCGILFHPYCAIKFNFSIKIENNNFICICDKKHKMFWTNENIDFIKLNLKNFTEYSLNSTSIYSKKNENENKKKGNFKRICIRTIKKNKNDIICLFNFSFIKSYLKSKNIFYPDLQNSFLDSDKNIFNWEITNCYFSDYEKEDFNNFFSYLQKLKKKDSIMTLKNEEKNKDNTIDNQYLFVKINKHTIQSNYIYLVLFNKSKLENYENENKKNNNNFNDSFDENIKNDNHITENNNFNEIQLLSRKRGLINFNFTNNKEPNNIINKLKLVKSEKIKKSTYKLLKLESETEFSRENSKNYTEDSIISKKQMLFLVQKEIMKKINKIKKKYKEDYINFQTRKKGEIENKILLDKYKSLSLFSLISKKLMNGVKTKTYFSILENINNKNQNNIMEIENIKEYIEKIYKNDSECCICFEIQEEIILFCDKCNVSFHPICYGIKEIPNGNYYCDKCQYELKNSFSCVKCFLCNNSHGALKFFQKENIFIHITCLLISQYYHFNNFTSLNSLNFNLEIDNNNKFCNICYSNKGELFNCNCCNQSYHFFCIYFDGGKIEIKKNENNLFYLNCVIEKCKNNKEWYEKYRNEQIEIRRLLYQKTQN